MAKKPKGRWMGALIGLALSPLITVSGSLLGVATIVGSIVAGAALMVGGTLLGTVTIVGSTLSVIWAPIACSRVSEDDREQIITMLEKMAKERGLKLEVPSIPGFKVPDVESEILTSPRASVGAGVAG